MALNSIELQQERAGWTAIRKTLLNKVPTYFILKSDESPILVQEVEEDKTEFDSYHVVYEDERGLFARCEVNHFLHIATVDIARTPLWYSRVSWLHTEPATEETHEIEVDLDLLESECTFDKESRTLTVKIIMPAV